MILKTDQTITRRVRLSSRLSVVLTFGAAGITCEWEPYLRRLSEREYQRYIAGRNAAAVDFARLIGGSVLCADLTKDLRGVDGFWLCYPDGRVERA